MYGQHLLPHVIGRVYGEQQTLFCILCTVGKWSFGFLQLDEIDLECIRIDIIGWNKMIKYDAVVVNFAKEIVSGQRIEFK